MRGKQQPTIPELLTLCVFQIALLPLGTGNDLSGYLGWGVGYTGGNLNDYLFQLHNTEVRHALVRHIPFVNRSVLYYAALADRTTGSVEVHDRELRAAGRTRGLGSRAEAYRCAYAQECQEAHDAAFDGIADGVPHSGDDDLQHHVFAVDVIGFAARFTCH
jgi:hypothetical protein